MLLARASLLAGLAIQTVIVYPKNTFAAAEQSAISASQVATFRAWMITVVEDQISRGLNPRWQHHDCAGLVRFAVSEAFAHHDERWRKVNGFINRPLPAELELTSKERADLKAWRQSDGEKSQFARALPLIQQNTVYIGKTTEHLEPGDLLFFDQGDEQHIMIWTGKRIVYHNGHRRHKGESKIDNGLRVVDIKDLLEWNDSRWQPRPSNPNFVGFYRLGFLQTQNERGPL